MDKVSDHTILLDDFLRSNWKLSDYSKFCTEKGPTVNPTGKNNCVLLDSPPVVNMTPLYPRQTLSNNQIRGTKRLISPICNNNSEESQVKENAKKLKVDAAIPKIADIVKKESAFDNPENSEKIKKIVSDFRIALQEDLHGNL